MLLAHQIQDINRGKVKVLWRGLILNRRNAIVLILIIFMRIVGITIPDNKRLNIGLTVLYGVGRSLARQILKQAKVDEFKKPTEITPEEEAKIRQIVESKKIEGDLKREVGSNIKRLKDIKSYRGSRHARKLPSRGQRTKTNSRTLRGNTRKTMGTGRKAPEKK